MSILPLLATTLFLASSSPADPAGMWEGKLDIGVTLRLVLHVTATDDGWETTLDSPDQGATGIPTSGTTFQDGELVVDVAGIGGKYRGTMNEAGDRLDGTWSQGGQELPLVLARVEELTTYARPQEPQPPFPYVEESVAIDAGNHTLAGTLTIPEGDGPFPGVVLVTGSGPQDRDETLFEHKPFWVIADHFARHGIASLRYDDRGTAQSTGSFSSATTLDFAADADVVAAYLAAHDAVDQVGIVGHSEGGQVAGILAATSSHLSFVVGLAAPAVSGEKILEEQTRLISLSSGVPAELAEQIVTINTGLYRAAITASDEARAAALSDFLAQQRERVPEAQHADLSLLPEHESGILAQFESDWFIQFLRYDPAEHFGHAKIPVLALFGERDLQVSATQNEARMRELLGSAPASSQVKTYSSLNHLFQTSTTGAVSEYAQIEETFAPQVMADMVSWIHQVTGD